MQIVPGFVAPFRGLLFVVRHGLWGYLLLPLLCNLVVAGVVAFFGAGLIERLLGSWFGEAWLAEWAVVGAIATGLLTLLAALLVFVVLQPVISAPFVDLLSERVERLVRGSAPSTTLMRSAGQAIVHGLLKTALYLFALLFTLVAGALTGVGGLLGAALYGIFLAYDGFDYPLARREVSFMGKWRYLLSHPGQTVGYCCGAGLFYLIPLATLLAPSFAAVGATLLYLDHSEEESASRADGHPAGAGGDGSAAGRPPGAAPARRREEISR